MEVPLSVLFAIFSLFSTFFSSILRHASLEKLGSDKTKQNRARRILLIKAHIEDYPDVFFIYEFVFHSFAGFLLVLFISDLYESLAYTMYFGGGFILLMLILRTLIRSIGRRYAETLSVTFAQIIAIFHTLLKPISKLLGQISKLISGHVTAEASREEIAALLQSSREDGLLAAGEYRILQNMMKFSSVLVSDVMTPRTVIFSADADKTVGDVVGFPEIQMYSRFPIWEESLDSGVMGYVLSKDVLHASLKDQNDRKLREFSREVYFIPENAELDNALDKFLQRRQHLFVVVDEYGGIEGLLTMEDVLETILGVEIVDEADRVVDLREYAKIRRDRRIASILEKGKK